MTGEGQGWVNRIDIAQLIQNKIDFNTWKGDDHTKGVFFDETYGITLNKIMAVRVRHNTSDKEKALKENLFFSFNTLVEEDGSSLVSEQYPFEKMKSKPKKHFLLFDKERLTKEEIDTLFESASELGKIRVRPQPIANALDKIKNKRDRERSAASLKVKDGEISIVVFRVKSKKKTTLIEETLDCEVLAEPIDRKGISATVNAHTLFYLLGIFYSFSYVTFRFARDRIMITGESGGQTPNVEVVVSRLKIA